MDKLIRGQVQIKVPKRKKRNLEETIYHKINGNNVPVFTPEFLEQNKLIEGELRQLRKAINDIEEHNSALSYYIESLTTSCDQARDETRELEELKGKLAAEMRQLEHN